jgi:hypothetical protein
MRSKYTASTESMNKRRSAAVFTWILVALVVFTGTIDRSVIQGFLPSPNSIEEKLTQGKAAAIQTYYHGNQPPDQHSKGNMTSLTPSNRSEAATEHMLDAGEETPAADSVSPVFQKEKVWNRRHVNSTVAADSREATVLSVVTVTTDVFESKKQARRTGQRVIFLEGLPWSIDPKATSSHVLKYSDMKGGNANKFIDDKAKPNPKGADSCEPMANWHTISHPACNDFHSINLIDESAGNRIKRLGQGFWRLGLAVDYPNLDTAVWKISL